ncbi:MAG: hypothetical protein B6U89_00660 [Desulfurococcales archaeon ex4484_58]|nr:MAG: hypothetical protein B6U89_00660 [Desulfurococcales archaeon ex4484_58]
MNSLPRENKILVIGDANLCIIGAAAGTDYYVFRGECRDLSTYIDEHLNDYGVYIVARDVYNRCENELRKILESEYLLIIIDPPKIMKEIDPKKYYEELVTKFVGMKISL